MKIVKEIIKIIVGSVFVFLILFLIINLPLFIQLSSKPPKILSKGEAKSATVPISPDPKIYLPKLDVSAPIIFSEKIRDIEEDLSRGVSHYPGSALPGQLGNVFLSGHSSDYPWKPGDFKQVFLYINQLEVGDKVYADYKGKRFSYTVKSKKIVDSDDRSIMVWNKNRKSLTMMTCYPPNTTFKRLAVIAEQD